MPTYKYNVFWKRRVEKSFEDLPTNEQEKLDLLIQDLRDKGPIRKDWPNFSRLDKKKGKYHCHLSDSWVACWIWEKKTIEIEVYYAGSREKAPYRNKGRHS